MIYDKTKGVYLTTGTDGDVKWLDRAKTFFLNELFSVAGSVERKVFEKWGVTLETDFKYCGYPKSFLKEHPVIKKEMELRNKLAQLDGKHILKRNMLLKKINEVD